jgi:hypothetical protein
MGDHRCPVGTMLGAAGVDYPQLAQRAVAAQGRDIDTASTWGSRNADRSASQVDHAYCHARRAEPVPERQGQVEDAEPSGVLVSYEGIAIVGRYGDVVLA